MTKTKKMLLFISRHEPNNGQVALAKKMGYSGIKKIDLAFSNDPVKDLEKAKITQKTISIVAPSYITNELLNKGYTLIEFINSPVKREKMVFCCEGAHKYKLKDFTYKFNEMCKAISRIYPDASAYFSKFPEKIKGEIEQEYIECPISIDEQVESSLVPTKSK